MGGSHEPIEQTARLLPVILSSTKQTVSTQTGRGTAQVPRSVGQAVGVAAGELGLELELELDLACAFGLRKTSVRPVRAKLTSRLSWALATHFSIVGFCHASPRLAQSQRHANFLSFATTPLNKDPRAHDLDQSNQDLQRTTLVRLLRDRSLQRKNKTVLFLA
ncbi:hypothetical protein Cob_v003973 [Colletotrichum orbiculare MAFF 240422]|uniref:Uncharacterized protein n=1 Tax=Colletotrichum orbiculare (strain 104-T / ATCC 96160 / CBS 514.97 / LARS 414 / MAFF 240422) TaxID=1213857 RepID=A0A484FZY8_COLOR|nr:hypothetical protein Cob_v003973 [Colletotrichum orbiculare MAFF 240422]